MRDLTVTGFYTTKMGYDDVGFVGNKPNQWNGVPPEVLTWADPESLAQVLGSIAGYLTVPGYSEVFAEAEFGEAVDLAASGADRETLVRALPAAAAGTVGLVGDLDAVRARVDAYAQAGLDEIALVPATAGDPGGERTLTALRPD